ncbi:FAD-dependent oxidoreductase [Romboutsia sp. 1001713B170207_170306_H8]|uniref:FAD-dependent oxidoreductase n=1 Tax=Romboutsia sp. 1001713B170207_170306_H8 TaxID=2787112 RepID=UPI002ED3CBE5
MSLRYINNRKEYLGGQAVTTFEIVNYPGIIETDGPSLIDTMRKQAESFGVNFEYSEVISMELDKKIKIIKTKNAVFKTKSIIIATGAKPRKVGFKGEDKFYGKGVSYCATCDGNFYRNLDVFVIGGGYSAAEESLFLARIARKVNIFVRKPKFSCAKSIANRVLENDKIEVKFNTEIVELGGEAQPTYIEYINNITNEKSRYELSKEDRAFGLFVLAGYIPATDIFKDIIDLDDYGYITTDDNMNTNIKGVYACGDLRQKSLRQVVTAVSDGAIAATECEKYIDENKHLFKDIY